LIEKRKVTIPESSTTKVPRELFMEFLQYLVYKNNGYTKNVKPPGLTPVTTLANVFFCTVRYLDDNVFNKPLD